MLRCPAWACGRTGAGTVQCSPVVSEAGEAAAASTAVAPLSVDESSAPFDRNELFKTPFHWTPWKTVEQHTQPRVNDNPLLHNLWEPCARRCGEYYGDECDSWLLFAFKAKTPEEKERHEEIERDQEVSRIVGTSRYAWAVPNEEALAVLKKYSPLVEVRRLTSIVRASLLMNLAGRLRARILGAPVRSTRG